MSHNNVTSVKWIKIKSEKVSTFLEDLIKLLFQWKPRQYVAFHKTKVSLQIFPMKFFKMKQKKRQLDLIIGDQENHI